MTITEFNMLYVTLSGTKKKIMVNVEPANTSWVISIDKPITFLPLIVRLFFQLSSVDFIGVTVIISTT